MIITVIEIGTRRSWFMDFEDGRKIQLRKIKEKIILKFYNKTK